MIRATRIARFQYHSHNMMQRSQQQIHHSCSSWARETATAARITISSAQSSPSTAAVTTQPPENKDQQQQNDPLHTTPSGGVMEQSFGVAYSTRSAEEGFGGIYGGNEDGPSTDLDNNQQAAVDHDSPVKKDEYYNKQESEVKVQEKAMQEPDKMGTS